MYNDKKGKKIELGCGKDWKKNKERHGFEGIDIYDYGQKHVLDIRDGLPFKENSIDAIRSSHFFEHLTYDEAINVLNDCWYVLKPEGKIHIIVPNAWKRQRAYVLTHRSFWTEATFKDLERSNRFEVYGIRRWTTENVITNAKGDIHWKGIPIK